MDRQIGTQDPLQRLSTLTYDLRGNPVSYKDRKGQYTAKTFDGMGRPISTGYGATTAGPNATFSGTQTYLYDGGNRLTSIVDSQNGTVLRTFDGLNRLTEETTPQGSISYSYDAAGRRMTALVNGQAVTAYTYDNANRMTGLTQGSTQVGIVYDSANRRSTLNLPNGVTIQYGYDGDSRLQSISYAAQGASLGNLSYVYDAAGRRTKVDGSFANTNLPAALASASYDAANQLATWDGIAAGYDPNGNMTQDINGNQYAWNSQNQLVGISGSDSATFSYDALGRRVTKRIGSLATSFQYDGVNHIAETSSGGTTALLPGSLDEYFLRTDNTGPVVPIVDALGSTLGLVNAAGLLGTTYWYDPYGGMSVSGAATTNNITYTGRETDMDGLMYYRARYYSPETSRFLSEDPAGLDGSGSNLYEYADQNPISLDDPFGLQSSYSGPYGPPQNPSPWGCSFSLSSCFVYYGNYGGPGWTGGQWQPWEHFGDPWSSDPNPPAGLAPPTDPQDACYMDHDRCYAKARHPRNGKCSSPQQNTDDNRSCDGELMQCLGGVNAAGGPGSNPFSVIAQPIFSVKELF